MYLAYVLSLTVVVGLAAMADFRRGGSALTIAALCLFYNWALNEAAISVTADPLPWQAFIATDGMCFALLGALAVASDGLARWGTGLLALTYAVQIGLNCSFVGGSAQADWNHWLTLTWIAFGQLAIVAAWAGLCLSRKEAA